MPDPLNLLESSAPTAPQSDPLGLIGTEKVVSNDPLGLMSAPADTSAPKFSTQAQETAPPSPQTIDVNQPNPNNVQALKGSPVAQGMSTGVSDIKPETTGERVISPLVRAGVQTLGTGALLAGGLAGLNPNPKTQDTLFKFYDATRDATAKLAPDADSSFVDKFVDGAIGIAPYLATGGAGAVSILANSAARGADAVRQGIDPKTATALGLKDLAMTTAMFRAPWGGQSIVGGAAKGVGINVGLDIADKALEKGILTAGDYDELAKKVHIADPESLGQSIPMGVAFGIQGSLGRQTMPTWYYSLTNKERALVPQTINDLKGKGYSDAQLARMNPDYFKQALAARMSTEQPSADPFTSALDRMKKAGDLTQKPEPVSVYAPPVSESISEGSTGQTLPVEGLKTPDRGMDRRVSEQPFDGVDQRIQNDRRALVEALGEPATGFKSAEFPMPEAKVKEPWLSDAGNLITAKAGSTDGRIEELKKQKPAGMTLEAAGKFLQDVSNGKEAKTPAQKRFVEFARSIQSDLDRTEIPVANLQEGQKFTRGGEEYKVTNVEDKGFPWEKKVTVKDGVTFNLSGDEHIDVDNESLGKGEAVNADYDKFKQGILSNFRTLQVAPMQYNSNKNLAKQQKAIVDRAVIAENLRKMGFDVKGMSPDTPTDDQIKTVFESKKSPHWSDELFKGKEKAKEVILSGKEEGSNANEGQKEVLANAPPSERAGAYLTNHSDTPIRVMDVYGHSHYVDKGELEGTKTILRKYKANGDRVQEEGNNSIHRGNIVETSDSVAMDKAKKAARLNTLEKKDKKGSITADEVVEGKKLMKEVYQGGAATDFSLSPSAPKEVKAPYEMTFEESQLDLGKPKGTDLRAPERENRPVSMDDLELGKATNAKADREKQGGLFERLKNERGAVGDLSNVKETKEPAENKNLATVHNISIENVLHALKMGGIPVPSLAAIDINKSNFHGFGDITLIAKKSAFAPEQSRENKWHGADAYSPRYPSVTHTLTEDTRAKLSKMFDDARADIKPTTDKSSQTYFGKYGWDEQTKDRGIADSLKNSHPLAEAAFLKEQGKLPKNLDTSYEGKEKVRKAVDKIGRDKFESWVDEKIKELGLTTDEKIFNGFTNAGNRRYLPHNLDTVVKLLKSQMKEGESFNYGAGSVRSKITPQFKTLKQIQESRDKIVSPEDFEKLKDEANNKLIALADHYKTYLQHPPSSNFGFPDTFSEHLKEAIETRNFRKTFDEYYDKGVDLQPAKDFVEKLRNMPTEYFEGKIQRAVGLNEFDTAIIPDSTPKDVVDALKKRGLNTVEYKKGDIADRKQKIQDVTTARRDELLYSFPGPLVKGTSQSVKDAISYLGKTQAIDGLKRGFAAVTREGAEKSAPILSEEVSKASRIQDQFEFAMDAASKGFSKSAPADNLDFMQRMDTGVKQATPELQTVADTIKRMFDQKVFEIQKLGTGVMEQVRENYFPHIWKRGEQSNEILRTLSKRPFEGSKGFLKQRVFDDVKTGIDAGYEPVSHNPIDLAVLKMMEMDKYIIAHRTIEALKEKYTPIRGAQGPSTEPEIKFFKSSEKPGSDYTQINDKFSTVWRPVKDAQGNVTGRAIAGHYYAKDTTAQVLNNYLSQNLYNNKYVGSLFKGYMGAANHLNQFQLGVFSAFHAGFTSFETIASQNALGIRQLSEGRFIDAAKSFGKAPIAFIANPIRGDKLIKEWRTPGSQGQEMAQIIDALVSSGGRLNALRAERFQTNDTKKMVEAWHKGGVVGKGEAILRSPLALVEQSAKPILKWLVPRQKFGVFGELMSDWMKQNPTATHDDMRVAARNFWNQVDERLGQVVYDRIFANNIAKNVVQALVRAPGWTGGTILQIGRGIADTVKAGDALLHGKKPVVTDRMAYTASLLITNAIICGTLTYLFTGEQPQDTDFWAFRTGRKDQYGKDERFMLPTYVKDIMAYKNSLWTTLGHKTHPLLSVGIDLAKNKDYYGSEIRAQDDDYITQLAQAGGYVAKAFVPFWIRGAQKASEQGKSIGDIAAPLVGIMPAPNSVTQTKAEKLINEMAKGHRDIRGFTKKEQDRNDLIREFTQQYRSGGIPTMGKVDWQAKQQGIYLTRQEYDKISMSKRTGKVADDFHREHGIQTLTPEEMMRAWKAMTPEEKIVYYHDVDRKIQNSKTISPEEKKAAYKTIDADYKEAKQ